MTITQFKETAMPKFRKKPVTVEARQLVGTTAEQHDVYLWIERNTQGSFDPLAETVPATGVSIDPATGFLLIATLEGVMQAKPGDWIIQGVQGEFYPCKPDIFDATYELVASPIAWTVTSARTVDIDTARGPLTVTRGALLIAQQDIELGASDFARVRGRYPSGASGFVLLDESQVLTLSAALLAAP